MVRDKYVQQALQQVRTRMEVRGLAPVTVTIYERSIRRFITHVGKPLGSVKRREVEEFLVELARRGIHPRTRNVILGALRFAFRGFRGLNPTVGVPMAKAPRRTPEILSGSEVTRLLDATTSPKYRAIFLLAYGAGLRVSEVVGLATTDIDSERMLLHVRAGKTGPRYVMLSPRVLEALRAYWRAFRPTGPQLFPGRGTAVADPHLTRMAVHKVLAKVARAAGEGPEQENP